MDYNFSGGGTSDSLGVWYRQFGILICLDFSMNIYEKKICITVDLLFLLREGDNGEGDPFCIFYSFF